MGLGRTLASRLREEREKERTRGQSSSPKDEVDGGEREKKLT